MCCESERRANRGVCPLYYVHCLRYLPYHPRYVYMSIVSLWSIIFYSLWWKICYWFLIHHSNESPHRLPACGLLLTSSSVRRLALWAPSSLLRDSVYPALQRVQSNFARKKCPARIDTYFLQFNWSSRIWQVAVTHESSTKSSSELNIFLFWHKTVFSGLCLFDFAYLVKKLQNMHASLETVECERR